MNLKKNRMTHLSPLRWFHLVLISAIIFISSGCSTYQNVTGYFNTYYNAKKLFGEAVAEIENGSHKYTDTVYFKSYTIAAGSQTKFDKVIEKCSKIIQFYPKSSWVDDAILMIGQSYVYKGENEGGIRKFQELIDNFPTGGLQRQAKLWIAKSNYFMKKDDEVLKITKDLFDEARAEGDNDVLIELLMLDAQIYFDRNEYAQAAAKYALAVEVSGDDKLRTFAQYQLGFMYERSNDFLKAAEAYNAVKNYKPDYTLLFQSRLKYGRMLTAAHQFEKALPVLDAVFEDKLSAEEQSLADLEIANTQWAKGDSASAFALYTLIDTVYKRTDASAKSYYQQGLIYENRYLNFKLAKEFYGKSKDEFPTSEVNQPAQQKSLMMTNYFKHYEDIRKYDSLLTLALHPEILQRMKDSLKARQDSLTAITQKSAVKDSTHRMTDSLVTSLPKQSDSTKNVITSPPSPVQGLPGVPDSLSQTLLQPPDDDMREEREGTRQRGNAGDSLMRRPPRMPNIPRKFASSSRDEDSLSTKGMKRDSLKNSKAVVQATVLSLDTLRSLLEQNFFELGGLFYLEFQRTDSALFWYSQVVERYPALHYTSRAMYAMAEIHRTQGDSSVVDSLYKIILDRYATSEYAIQIRKNLGMDTTMVVPDPAVLSYREAEQLLQEDKIERSIEKFKEIAKEYVVSPYAPKSLYTIGWIYENLLIENDTAAVWYKKLVKEYPSSLYANSVQAKLAVKNDPKTLQQYVKIKEIQSIPKETRSRNATARQHNKLGQDEQLLNGRDRNQDRDNIEDNTDDEEDQQDTPEETDDNN